MLLVSLSFISMFKQAEASGDKASGQEGQCRWSWNCTPHCNPQKCASQEAIHPGTWAGGVIWVSLAGVQHADSSLKPKITVNSSGDQILQWQLCHIAEDLSLMLGFSADAARHGTCEPMDMGGCPQTS